MAEGAHRPRHGARQGRRASLRRPLTAALKEGAAGRSWTSAARPAARAGRLPGTPLLQPTDERRRTGSALHAARPHRPDRAPRAGAGLRADRRPGDARGRAGAEGLRSGDAALAPSWSRLPAARRARLVKAWARHPDARACGWRPTRTSSSTPAASWHSTASTGWTATRWPPTSRELSLWLATLARDHEFTFLDHALRTGDSLVGLTRAQIGGFRWQDGQADVAPFSGFVRERVRQALEAREAIRGAPDDVEQEVQQQRFRHVERLAAQARMLGDATLAAFLSSDKPKARETARRELGVAASQAPDRVWPRLEAMAAGLTTGQYALRPFHWDLEFPEVFSGEMPGFDALVGNPPFLGGKRISGEYGSLYVQWLQALHADSHGNADLVTHFLRRAFALLRPNGCLGLIATNTVGQGDTRESGLRVVLEAGGSVLRAIRRLPWPGEAAVVVSVVHIVRGSARSPVLDGRQVRRISAYLVEGDLDASPTRLVANVDRAFQGCILLGMGFTFDDVAVERGKAASTLAEMKRLIARNPRNAERIFPYLGGEEVNTDARHAHRRWCIDFADFPLQREASLRSWFALNEADRAICLRTGLMPIDYPEPVAADWPDLLEIVERLVRPEVASGAKEAKQRNWWKFWRIRPGLRRALVGLDQVVVISLVSPQMVFAIVPTGQVFAHRLAVFVSEPAGTLGCLQSRLHEVWTRCFTSTFEDRLNYSPTDCFETFPLPDSLEDIAEAAKEYLSHRQSLMIEHQEGLTETYNRFHDSYEHSPGILVLRKLHNVLDHAVLNAYGWSDLATLIAPEFLTEDTEPDHRYQRRLFWPALFRDEVLARLLALNAERAAHERAHGLAPAATAEELEDA